jgi:two-component system, OmpR family, response regulator ChvI
MQRRATGIESLGGEPSFQARSEPMPEIRIVIIDGDIGFRDMLSNELSEQGLVVTTFPDVRSALAASEALSTADLVALDWAFTGGSGLDLLGQLRREGVNLPIAFLTRRSLASNERLALEHGAIDFIDKSRGMSLVALRLQIAGRNKASESRRDRVLRVGKLVLKPRVSQALWNDVDVEMTAGEFKIIDLLARNAGKHVSYREIYDVLHYRGFVAGVGVNGYKTNVKSAIKRIRRKFEALDPTFDRIQNYTAFGYIWAQD